MKKIIAYIFIISLIVACGTTRKGVNKADTSSYKRDENTIHPQFTIFHVNDTLSELHFKIKSRELLYTRPDGINFTSNVLIFYRLSVSYDSKEFLDSASVRLVDVNNDNSDKFLISKMNLKAKAKHSYFVRITVTDLNRNINSVSVIKLEKENDLNRQNFLVKSKETDATMFNNFTKTGEELIIKYKAKIAVNLYVRYYHRNFPLAAPPFSLTETEPFKYKADSTFTLQLSQEGSVNFTATRKGFYHFQLDTSKRDGLTIFNFSDEFPEIKKADEMILPLRFITTKQEYDDLMASANKKDAMEKFWINCSGNQEKAREVIRKFYNRMQDANLYFTSYLEGWKTDRGMIYLIYGAPNTIYRSGNSETWTYGEENNINSSQYTFTKVNNPFTNNDFILDRSAAYKQSWYIAVDIWRQGRTYLQD